MTVPDARSATDAPAPAPGAPPTPPLLLPASRTPVDLDVAGLAKAVDGRVLWSDVTAHLRAGTITVVTGPSGAGKTTFLHCLGSLERPTAGRITCGGEDLGRVSGRRRRVLLRDVFGFLFQDHLLVEQWSVRCNLDVALAARGLRRRDRADAAAAALGTVRLEGTERSRVRLLSGGEQQRVGLARLVAHRPAVVLVDEPTASLGDEDVELVLALLRAWADAGATVVAATHDARLVAISDQQIALAAGVTATSGTARRRWSSLGSSS